MKNNYFSNCIFLVLVVCFFAGCTKNTSGGISVLPSPSPPSPVVPAFHDSIQNGVNLQPSYYNEGNPNFGWDLMKQKSKIKTVRIEIEPDKATQAISWISQAQSNGFKVIATYHKYKALGSDDAAELTAAAEWWKQNFRTLGGNFIINLMNEWGSHNISATDYAKAYNNAISIVREVYNGPIIIDIPGWGQETLTAYLACKTSNPVIADTNIILSAHIYSNGWNQGRNHSFQASDLDDIVNSGRRGMVGEFGNGGGGSVDWSACIDYAKSKGWPVIGWCWNGDGGNMNMVNPSWAVDGTASAFTTNAYFDIIYNKL